MRRTGWFTTATFLAAALAACSEDLTVTPDGAGDPLRPGIQASLGSAFDAYAWLPPVLDDGGPNDAPAQSDLNSFSRADNVPGFLGVLWTWDDINSWTGSGQTGDACALFDTDANSNGNANFALCVRITNSPDGQQVFQLNPGSPVLYQCGDKRTDRCSQPVSVVPIPAGGTICEVTTTDEAFPGAGDDGADVLAACAIKLSDIQNATRTNILNVCSFPSGSPNSNPFDCVVTAGAGYIQIKKKTTPQESGHTFSFTLSPAATSGQTAFQLADDGPNDESTALIAVKPTETKGGTSSPTYSITEGSLPAGWALDKAECRLQEGTTTGTRNGQTVSGIQVDIGETTVCTFENKVGAPTIEVTKTADPTSLPETGGSVTYTVEVKNTSVLPVTLDELTDDKFGDLNGKGTGQTACATGGSIAAGATYTCVFTETLAAANAGTEHENVVTAKASNAGGTATDTDDATVSFTDVAPTIEVTKTASPDEVPESGGSVTYEVKVKNTSAEPVTLTTLTDDKFGNLNGQGTCATGGSIAAGATYTCSFSKSISGNAGTSHVNVVSATVTDDDGTTATDTDDATVTFTDVGPTLEVTKTASPTSVPETGGGVTYTVDVQNTSGESVTLTTLTDDKFGNLNGQGTGQTQCATGGTIAAGATYTCSFSKTISGNAGTSHVNVVSATVTDDDGTTATDTDDATVTFTDVKPSISATKTANPTSLGSQTGGGLGGFVPDRTFTANPTGGPDDGSGFAPPTCDDAGPNDVPAQVDLNCFTRADDVPGWLGIKWTWDDINAWTGSGQTGDACALLDTDNDGKANFAYCVRVTNSPDGAEVFQLDPPGSPLLYSCGDSRTDRCAQPVSLITNQQGSTCSVTKVPEAFPGQGDDGQDTEAACDLNLAAINQQNPSGVDLINVCSFPSGSPNSNPFDCVVSPGVGFIQIVKVVSPATSQLSGFSLSPGSTDGTSAYGVAGGITSALLPAAPGTDYSLTEVLVAGWTLVSVTCAIDGVATGTPAVEQNKITGFEVKVGQTTVCTFTNSGAVSGEVEYTVTVTNEGLESVTLESLMDDKFGNLNGVGTCATGGTIAGGATYSCKFTKTLTGDPGTSHTNKVTAKAKDDENNEATAEATATVTFEGNT